ncbi:hypothetical protein HPC49_48035, partial [Pyxidicoccus fallax]|nr:hypothetical protein [Pyxidicoccus fallax]
SVGVWCGGASGVALTDGGVTFTVGAGGPGGASTANPGDTGLMQDVVDCQPIP